MRTGTIAEGGYFIDDDLDSGDSIHDTLDVEANLGKNTNRDLLAAIGGLAAEDPPNEKTKSRTSRRSLRQRETLIVVFRRCRIGASAFYPFSASPVAFSCG